MNGSERTWRNPCGTTSAETCEPHWASREQRIGQLYNLIDFKDDLVDAARLEVVEAIAVLSKPEDDEDFDDADRVRAGERVKRMAPGAWRTAVPILQTVVGSTLKKKLGLE